MLRHLFIAIMIFNETSRMMFSGDEYLAITRETGGVNQRSPIPLGLFWIIVVLAPIAANNQVGAHDRKELSWR